MSDEYKELQANLLALKKKFKFTDNQLIEYLKNELTK